MERKNLPCFLKAFLILLGILVSVSVFASDATNGWDLAKESDGIKVYTRNVSDSDFKEFKGVMQVKTTVDALVALVNDAKACPKWIDTCVEGKVLKKVSDNERYCYTLSEAPWPVSDRDAITHSITNRDEKTGAVTINITGAPNYIPEKKGITRVKMIKAMWSFTPKEDGYVEVVYQVHNDPGGSLPAWLINSVAVTQPFNTLRNMRKIVKNYE